MGPVHVPFLAQGLQLEGGLQGLLLSQGLGLCLRCLDPAPARLGSPSSLARQVLVSGLFETSSKLPDAQCNTGEAALRQEVSCSRGTLGICQLLLPLGSFQDEPVVLGLLGPACLLLLRLQGTAAVVINAVCDR